MTRVTRFLHPFRASGDSRNAARPLSRTQWMRETTKDCPVRRCQVLRANGRACPNDTEETLMPLTRRALLQAAPAVALLGTGGPGRAQHRVRLRR